MGFQHLGSFYGAAPVVRKMLVGADTYVGQLLAHDGSGYGHVKPCTAAAAGPDTTMRIVGICVGVNAASPSYSSSYGGDFADYDSSQADQLANDPKGGVEVLVAEIHPGDKIKAPICVTSLGTAPTVLTASSTDAAGDDIAHASNVITSPVSLFSTIYCRTRANRGLSRIITAGSTADQDVDGVMFPYDIAVGDTFVAASLKLGYSEFDIISTQNAFEAFWASNYFEGFCHDLNLEVAGAEYAVLSINPKHLAG